MHPLHKKIIEAKAAKKLAVIPFLTAWHPDRSTFWEIIKQLDRNGADIIEIGIPFSDPVADGPVVEDASRQSLEAGFELGEFIQELAEKRRRINAEIVLMGYYNPFLQYGLEKLTEDADKAGVGGFIVPDLPIPENRRFKDLAKKKGIALIPLVGPNTSAERMAAYAKDAEGYAYVVSVMGTTGERSSLSEIIDATLQLAKKTFNIPVALGFGLKHPEQLEGLPMEAMPDAAVFGSALIRHIAADKPVAEFMSPWKNIWMGRC